MRERSWLWLAAALGALNVAVLLARAKSIVAGLYREPDTASAPVIGALINEAGPDAKVTLGQYPWFEPLWFMQATEWLPGHRQLWEAAPFALMAASFTVAVWAAWRVFGRDAGVLTAAVLASSGIGVRLALLPLNAHGWVTFHTVVLAAALALVAVRRRPLSDRALVIFAAALGVFTAAGATDRLLLVTGVIPFAVAAVAVWLRSEAGRGRQIALFSTVVTLLAVGGSVLITAVMRRLDIAQTPLFEPKFLSLERVTGNISLELAALTQLGSGDFWDTELGPGNALTFTAGVLVLAAVALTLRALWRRVSSAGFFSRREDPPADVARHALIVFWGTALVSTLAAFYGTSVASVGPNTRYIVVSFVALAVLVPALAWHSRAARVTVIIGVVVFSVLALRAQLQEDLDVYGYGPTADEVSAVEQFVEQHGVTHGYAGYGDAPVITWQSHLRVRAYPLSMTAGRLAPIYNHTISSWYSPRAPVFIVTRDTKFFAFLPRAIPGLGRPSATARFGQLNVSIYPRGIGHALAPRD
jgi:hypothetical protein